MALQLIRCTNMNRSFQACMYHNRTNKIKVYLQQNINGIWNSNRIYSTQSKPRWNSWRNIVIRFIPIGVCLIAVMQWRAYRKMMNTRIAAQWEIDLYCSLPLRAFSRYWGWMAEKQLPESVRPLIYGLYASTFGVDISEAESPNLKDYPSLSHFFARALKDGVRNIDTSSSLISPCDGKVLHFGPVNSNKVEQVKGITYSLEQFIGDPFWQENLTNLNVNLNRLDYRDAFLQRPENKPTTLYQCVLYLAPGDYHRFHSPADWTPIYRRHFSGELLSVSPICAKWIPGLFCLNERAVYLGYWEHGFFSFTAVGATNVGSVKVYFDDELETNKRSIKKLSNEKCVCNSATLKQLNIRLEKGDPLGEFRMGSTIVLIFEAPANFEFNLSPGQTVRMGQALGTFRRVKHVDKIEKTNISSSTYQKC